MASSILTLDRTQRAVAAPAPAALGVPADVPARLHFWRGASGKRYVHSVYSLIECPPFPNAMYLLVQRTPDGRRRILQIAAAESDAPTLNLARIRQRGAQLDANEVHIYFPAATRALRGLATCDLRAGQFGALSAEPSVLRATIAG